MRKLLSIYVFAFVLYAGLTNFHTQVEARPSLAVVNIENMQFNPKDLSISYGQQIEWVNKDLVPHTVTAQGVFDSQVIAPGKSWKYKPVRKGRFDYKCSFHPTMSASLEIK